MNRKQKDLRDQVRKWLDEFGATQCQFEITGKCHQRATFSIAGRRLSYVFASTTGDRRTARNTRSSLRHLIASATGSSLSAVSQGRPVLHASGVLPRQPHDVGGCGGRVQVHPTKMAYPYAFGTGSFKQSLARIKATGS